MESSSSMSLLWLIPVVAILVITGAILVSKQIRRLANDESLFDDDRDEAPANHGFNVKILLVIVPLAALVVWAVLSLIADKGESFAVDEISLPLTEEAAYMDDEIPST